MLNFMQYLMWEGYDHYHSTNFGLHDEKRPKKGLRPGFEFKDASLHSRHRRFKGKEMIKGKTKPIWLSTSKHAAKHYDQDSPTGTYKTEISGKVAHHRDKNVKRLLKKHGVGKKDRAEFHNSMKDHRYKKISSHKVAKVLKKKGYVGYTHPDDDHENYLDKHQQKSTVVFHPKHVKLTKKLEHDPDFKPKTKRPHKEWLKDKKKQLRNPNLHTLDHEDREYHKAAKQVSIENKKIRERDRAKETPADRKHREEVKAQHAKERKETERRRAEIKLDDARRRAPATRRHGIALRAKEEKHRSERLVKARKAVALGKQKQRERREARK